MKEIYLKNPDPVYLKSALKHSLVCDSIGKLIQKNAILEETGLNFSSKYQKLSSLTIYICTKLNILFPQAGYDKDAFYFSALPKSNYLSYQVNQKDKEISIDTLELKQFQLSEAIRNLENQLQSFAISNSPKELTILKEELYSKRVEAYLLSFKIKKRKIFMDSYPVDVLQESIPDHKAIVNYNIADSVLYTILMDNTKIQIRQTNISKEFYSNISDLYKSIKTGKSDFGNCATYLSDILIKPIIDELDAKTELVIIPDGDLFRIPFDLLPVSNLDSKSYLIEKFAISYNYSPFLWYKSNEKSLKNKGCEDNLLAMAPVFAKDEDAIISDDNPFRSDSLLIRDGIFNSMGKSLSELPYSYKEVKSIERLFDKQDKKSKVLCFGDACEESFKKYAGEYKYIHLATHGFSSINNVNLSGLFFSQNENSQIDKDFTNDGFLYSGEMYCLENSADLVVLSACKTGTGRIAQGEGVLGIPRGFIYAGVPNIMVSLWKIHDKNTKDLMVDFYENLLAGDDYAIALKKAKLTQIKKGALPLDWSGIVLIGN
ncbi:MAG: CHAT domain-containing protein [Bacteroidales bacterium]|nr:CHAT domain-containing protein [Bacteroidales bacterium]